MSVVKTAWSGAIAATLATVLATSAAAQMELKIIAPAAPGGGWDQTARSLQQAMTAEKLVKSAQVINIPGAGGTVGLAQFVNNKGDGNTLMVNGFVMVGAILLNKSPVNLYPGDADCAAHGRDPGHRRARQFADQGRQGPRGGGEEGRRARHLRRRLGRRRRPHHGRHVRRRGPAATLRRSTTCRSRAAASCSPRSWAAA